MPKKIAGKAKNFCPDCGNPRLAPDSKFCDKCGSPMEAGATASAINNQEPSNLSPLEVIALCRSTSEKFRQALNLELAEKIDSQTAIGAGYAELMVRGLATANPGGVEKISAANNRLDDILRRAS